MFVRQAKAIRAQLGHEDKELCERAQADSLVTTAAVGVGTPMKFDIDGANLAANPEL
jgi:hypothetical protein